MSNYAITDIHGCAKTFRKLITEIIKLEKTDHLYLLGDYIDRGPDSKGVIDFIFELREQGYHVTTLRGNHEQMLLESHKSPRHYQGWVMNGGGATLESFGAKGILQIPRPYLKFFSELDYYAETDTAFLVHAGFNFDHPNFLEDTQAMMWLRNMKIDHDALKGKHVVHGHTPTPLTEIRKMVDNKETEINIDNGCKWAEMAVMGNLLALDLDTLELFVQENIEED